MASEHSDARGHRAHHSHWRLGLLQDARPPTCLPPFTSLHLRRSVVESFAQGHLHRQPLVAMPLAKTALPAALCSAADAFAMALQSNRWR